MPISALTFRLASSTDSQTWTTFDQAITACQHNAQLEGVGFVFTAEDSFAGVDLDDCLDEEGNPKSWALPILEQLDSYAEVSPSGKGLKIFVKASKTGTRCRAAYHDGAVEMYDNARFFTVTGNQPPGGAAEVHERQREFDSVYELVFESTAASRSAGLTPPALRPAPPPPPPPPPRRAIVELDDDQIVKLASESPTSGSKFTALWSGKWEGAFVSQSEADSSLIFMMAFYTKAPDRLDRLFRRSGLMRPKWDEQRGAETYGQRTIANALSSVSAPHEETRGTFESTSVPELGTVDPTTGKLILSTKRTLPTARAFLDQFHYHPDGLTLRQYAEIPMVWQDNRYIEIEDEAIRNRLLP